MSRDVYAQAGPVGIQAGSTSYFSAPEEGLDPKLFDGTHLAPHVRNGILRLLFDFLNERFMHPDLWCHVWLAGSGVSYQWSAQREPADLDVLIGVDFVQFRKAHPQYMGLSDSEIAAMMNEEFHNDLHPQTCDWDGFEVTFYVNANGSDIRNINPYAAYDLTHDEWTVYPSKQSAQRNLAWDEAVHRDRTMALNAVSRYSQALTDLRGSQNDASRRNAETRLHQALDQGAALFDDIHHGRKLAFSQSGRGYSDFHNYRWQAGKEFGTVHALRKMRDYRDSLRQSQEVNTYGVELPDTKTLLRRAALYRMS